MNLRCPSTATLSMQWVTVASALIVIFLGVVGMATFFSHDDPIKVTDASATGYRISDVTVIEYDRTFTVSSTFLGRVSRVVECDGVRTFDIPSITRPFTIGKFNTSRTFSVPFRYPNGAICKLRTIVEWRPSFSLRDHLFEIPSVEFRISAPPSDQPCAETSNLLSSPDQLKGPAK